MTHLTISDHFASIEQQIATQGYAVIDSLMPESEIKALHSAARQWYQDELFRAAKIGKLHQKQKRQDIRSDEICWIHDWSEPGLTELKVLFDQLQLFCRRSLFLPIKHYEAHLAVYHPGSFYLWHRDRHKLFPSRQLSAVFYLNELSSGQGGRLEIKPTKLQKIVSIRPKAGRLVLFPSDQLHQVSMTSSERWSVTCWFRDDMPHSPLPAL